MKTILHKLSAAVTASIGDTGRQRLFAVALILCCAGFAFAARVYNGSSRESEVSTTMVQPRLPSFPTASPATQAAKGEPVRVLKFSLFDVGIYPREVHVDKGLIAITTEDYSGGNSDVIIDRETGAAPERAGRVDRMGPHWRSRGEMRLGPGHYRIYMADRPTNQALLVVEP